MHIANNAKKVTDAVNTSNEHAIVSKVVADLYMYINRMQWHNAPKCQSKKPEQAAI